MNKEVLHSLYSINVNNVNSQVDFQIKYNDYNYLHDHDYFELLIILNGSYINQINGVDYVGTSNDAYLLRPSDLHKLTNNSPDAEHLNVMFTYNFFKTTCENISPHLFKAIMELSNIHIKLNQADSNKILSLLNDAKNSLLFDDNLYYNLLINDLMYNILTQLGLFKEKNPPWLTEIQKLLSSEQSLSLSVDDLVKNTHYSHTHLSRLFKEKMGISMVKYIQEVKLDYAVKYLVYSSKSISEIASMIGYKEASHFNHIFKKRFGITPLEYRKTQSKDKDYI